MIDHAKILLPDWVHWLAQDEDGSWWGYQVEPLQNHRGWYENEVGQHIKVPDFTGPCSNWQASLTKIK
ncbi:MAG: hypothetical protein OEY43_02290 [Gammaproteobacteria bacterium]|nr:hypothetical protein [Gammaproteobacteria bacterium]